MKSKPIKSRNGPYPLPKYNGQEAWFYTNRGSIDLVVHSRTNQFSLSHRIRVRDMERIIAALRSK